MTGDAIDCEGLGRVFGETAAVEGVTFRMAEGEFLGLLGPNGAGKSTLLAMLATLLAPTAGTARVAGADVRPSCTWCAPGSAWCSRTPP